MHLRGLSLRILQPSCSLAADHAFPAATTQVVMGERQLFFRLKGGQRGDARFQLLPGQWRKLGPIEIEAHPIMIMWWWIGGHRL